MGDFNPGFSFDIQEEGVEFQAPWEFAGALQHAEKSHGTSIDYKIRKHLAQRGPKKRRKATATSSGSGSEGASDLASPSDHDDDDDDDDNDDDQPLPGEEDEEDGVVDSDDLDMEDSEEDLDGARERAARPSKKRREDAIVIPIHAKKRLKPGMHASADDKELGESESDGDGDGQSSSGSEEEEEEVSDEADVERNAHQSTGNGNVMSAEKSKKKSTKDSKGFDAVPQGTTFSADSFAALNLSRPLVRSCAALGYQSPTPIQAACIPLALTGRDICGSAITGSGKTAAFALPLLERLLHRNRRVAATYVLILCPTRELAVQVHSMVQRLAQFTDITAALVVGGLSLQAQGAALRAAPEIVVATPGRLIDHLRNSQGFGLEDLATLVLDEADRLLEMGFAEEVREIVRMAPSKRQTLLFSATMTDAVKDLATMSLRHPVRLAADAVTASPARLAQEVIRLRGAAAAAKEATLLALASRTLAQAGKTIVFFSTKQKAHRAKILFGLANLAPAAELHGDMTQAARLESLESFRKGEVAFLLATDVAARGLDILGVETVVNFDCPRTLASYLHRVGRTARAGAGGRSITLAEDEDRSLLREVVKRGGVELQQRRLPVQAVSSWQDRIEKMQSEVRKIYDEEAEEKALRKAEMEAVKATNMIEHGDEIYARPARTWFQTTREKKDIAARARFAAENGFAGRDSVEDALPDTIKKKIDKNAAKSARRMERKLATAKESAAEASGKRKNKLMDETAGVTGKVRAAKARAAALREEGVPAFKASRIAAAMVSGGKKKQSKNSDKSSKQKQENGAGTKLFSGDGIGKPGGSSGASPKVYAGGARTAKPKSPSAAARLAGAALSRVKRGGKGKHSFKSKARHKRR